MNIFSTIKNFLTFIRFSHTLFALPFALGAMIVAAHGCPSGRMLGLMVSCMIFARTAAMTFNRLADWEIDQVNPRTAKRHTLVKKPFAIVACTLSSLLFIVSAAAINQPCLLLSPVALFLIFFYSWTKRFTVFTSFFLGLALAIAPLGAWIAVTGSLTIAPCLLALGVLCWVAGFDIIYAIQDLAIDRQVGLYSVVVGLGIERSLRLVGWLHGFLLVGLISFGVVTREHLLYYFWLLPVPYLLVYEHQSAKTLRMEKIQQAFFQTNIAVSFLFLMATFFGT